MQIFELGVAHARHGHDLCRSRIALVVGTESQYFNATVRVEEENVLVFEAPASSHGSDVRLERKEGDFAQAVMIFRSNVLPIFAAGGNAVADVTEEIKILKAGRCDTDHRPVLPVQA